MAQLLNGVVEPFLLINILSVMIALYTLKYLSAQKVKDAVVLLKSNRHAGSIYLIGYALEFSLKRKLSQTIGFNRGFPETGADFNTYATQIRIFTAGTGVSLTQVRQIRNHDLNTLLTYSGVEALILGTYYEDWAVVQNWNPESRYDRRRISHDKSHELINSAKRILKQIV
jgi:hypothetical protein